MTTHSPIRSRAIVRRTLQVLLPALVIASVAATFGGVPEARPSSASPRAGEPTVAAGFGYPIKPFHAEHPIRAYLGEPRMIFRGPPTSRTLMASSGSFSFHQGVDIAAPNGTAVYPVASGEITHISREWVRIDSGGGRQFEYWHIHPIVSVGQHVEAYTTVLGRIFKPEMHVHLTVYENGRVVNPLARGRLTPYTDTTAPKIASIAIASVGGAPNLPNFVRGRIRISADASDLPTRHVPGIWGGLPTIPARISWHVSRWTGKVVLPERTAIDFRLGVQPNDAFWSIYARGTFQNMAVFGQHYSYLQPGQYLFNLTRAPLDTRQFADGVYDVVVTATDIRGNHSSSSKRFTVHNRQGWIGSN